MLPPKCDLRTLAQWTLCNDRPQVYLDTGILGQLASGQVSSNHLDRWLSATNGYIGIYRYHCMELAKRGTGLVTKIVRYLERRESFLVAVDPSTSMHHGRNNTLPLVFQSMQALGSDSSRVVIEAITNRNIDEIRNDVADAKVKLEQLRVAVDNLDVPPWEGLPDLALFWILLSRTEDYGELEHKHLNDPDFYSEYKLQMCVYLHRKIYQDTKWRDSDYADFLHCLDMAHAQFVITERGLAETLRQINARVPGLAPARIETIDWLRNSS